MRARRLLKNKGVEFEEIRVGSGNSLWKEMEEKSGRNTVPQIFINGEPVGGYDCQVHYVRIIITIDVAAASAGAAEV